MPPPATANEFLDLVHKCGVLDEARFHEAFPDDSDLPADPRECAAALVRADLLTPYQAGQLLAGKSRGFILGPYRLLRPLGQGGMGIVYLAEHRELGRKVAVKILPTDKAVDKVNEERFLREARAAAALDHPNIVRIFDVCRHGKLRYLVMEYVEGETLETLLTRGGPMGLSRSVGYAAQAAAGLQHAHEKGFVHRDVKPANLMLTADGMIKLLDMGLARSTDRPGDKLTENLDAGAVIGTADFISPEQATNADVDIRADIYSLGATFFALVTGRSPFGGSTTQKLAQHQLKTAPNLADQDKTVPPGLAAVVAKMLAKKPADRYRTPADVIAALAPWLPDAGAARVVAGLSETDMGRTEELRETMTGLVSGKKRGGRKPLVAGVPNGWLYAGGGAAALLVVVVAIVLMTGRFDTPSARTSDPPPVAAYRPSPPPAPPQVPPPSATPAYDRTEGKDGLIGRWRFDAPVAKEVKDAAGLGEPAAVEGVIEWAQVGDRAGLVFSGDGGMVRVPDHRRLRFTRTESFTLAVWVKAPDDLHEGRWQGVVCKPFGRADGWYGLWLSNWDGQPTWAFGTTVPGDPQCNLFGTRPNGQWQLVCIVQDVKTGRRIYVDGKDVTRGPAGRAKDCDALGDLQIGSCVVNEPDGRINPEPFRGAISDVRVYNRALSAVEMLDMFQKND